MCQGNLGHKMWVCMDVKKKVPSREPFLYHGGVRSLERTSLHNKFPANSEIYREFGLNITLNLVKYLILLYNTTS